MHKNNWEEGWLDEILNQAEQAVQSWPDWMRQPELRYPLNRHALTQKMSPGFPETGNKAVPSVKCVAKTKV